MRRFGALFGIGLVGVAAVAATTVLGGGLPEPVASLPPALLFVLVSVQPAVLLAVAVLVGQYAAPRVGLRSRLRDRAGGDTSFAGFAAEVRPALALGGVAGVVLLAAGALFGPAGAVAGAGATVGSVLAGVPLRFLYGGITEELLGGGSCRGWRRRWRASSAANGAAVPERRVGGHRRRGRPVRGGPPPGGGGAVRRPHPGVVAFVVLGNALGGLAYGWLFYRYSLEAAMVGHAATHVVFVAVSLVLVVA
ncbi:CPBP family intramembrane glutamate endopeptidase [Halobaculum litoreum]|uniref:CPBP family intramembrane glutamate endopeptidase n=1 Tax=Halobaculum litoreum TaxID=3031998 RepID=A0ABD5XX10_9EURY